LIHQVPTTRKEFPGHQPAQPAANNQVTVVRNNPGMKNKKSNANKINFVTDSGVVSTDSGGKEAVIDALMNTPEYSGMSREEVASIVYGNK
jgi:hypothetical protein